jgi:hypothetical protein
MDKENQPSTECKFYCSETVQTMRHEFCSNPKMLEINKPDNGKKLKCMGSACGCWKCRE